MNDEWYWYRRLSLYDDGVINYDLPKRFVGWDRYLNWCRFETLAIDHDG